MNFNLGNKFSTALIFLGLLPAFVIQAETASGSTFSNAATNTTIEFPFKPPCSDVESSSIPGATVVAACPNSSATVSAGNLGVAATASAGLFGFIGTESSATFGDTISFSEAFIGKMIIPLDFSGSLKSTGAGNFGSFSEVRANVFGPGVEPLSFAADLSVDASRDPPTIQTGTQSEIKDLVVNVVGSSVQITTQMFAASTCSSVGEGSWCLSSALYSNSLRFLGASLFDESGEELDHIEIFSASGFDYKTGLPPHSSGLEPIPVPASGFLLLFAIGAIAFRRTKNKSI